MTHKKSYKELMGIPILLFVILWLIPSVISTEPSYMEALNKHDIHSKWKLINVVDASSNHKYAFYVTDNAQVRVTSLTKKIFGWKVGITIGGGTSLDEKNYPKGIAGYSTDGTTILYGLIKDEEISRIEVNDYSAKVIPIDGYDYRIWYVTENIEENNEIIAFDKNMEKIY